MRTAELKKSDQTAYATVNNKAANENGNIPLAANEIPTTTTSETIQSKLDGLDIALVDFQKETSEALSLKADKLEGRTRNLAVIENTNVLTNINIFDIPVTTLDIDDTPTRFSGTAVADGEEWSTKKGETFTVSLTLTSIYEMYSRLITVSIFKNEQKIGTSSRTESLMMGMHSKTFIIPIDINTDFEVGDVLSFEINTELNYPITLTVGNVEYPSYLAFNVASAPEKDISVEINTTTISPTAEGIITLPTIDMVVTFEDDTTATYKVVGVT